MLEPGVVWIESLTSDRLNTLRAIISEELTPSVGIQGVLNFVDGENTHKLTTTRAANMRSRAFFQFFIYFSCVLLTHQDKVSNGYVEQVKEPLHFYFLQWSCWPKESLAGYCVFFPDGCLTHFQVFSLLSKHFLLISKLKAFPSLFSKDWFSYHIEGVYLRTNFQSAVIFRTSFDWVVLSWKRHGW